MPENPKSVIAALRKVMEELPGIGKEGENVQQHFKYRGIEQITVEVQPLLAKHGVIIVPRVVSWERDEITINDKPWTDDRLTVEYTFYGPEGDSITALVPGVGRDNSDKGSNKAMSGAFKYALLQVFCIGDDKDDADKETHETDTRARTGTPAKVYAPQASKPTPSSRPDTGEKASEPQLRKIHILMTQVAEKHSESFDTVSDAVVADFGPIEELTKKLASEVIDKLIRWGTD